ncbi:NEDD8-conjugating protein [Martiniozyma asiatica (nom. inval.)]|nr:NEDD8-conjugating protein [Martiniozyma asiatica]
MLKLKKLQQRKQEEQNSGINGNSSIPPSILRAKRDMQEYENIPGVEVKYDPGNRPMHVSLVVSPVEGYYAGGKFQFECEIPQDYPHNAPEFRCLNKIYHPNIDLEGHVCLNILRSDWKPTLSLQLVFAGILHLFLQPNPTDPLNKDAANDLAKTPEEFARHVRNSMAGGSFNGVAFDRVENLSSYNGYY